MAHVIIRLQGLPWTAAASDIRQFFQGLSIPPGGVHIVGGDLGDAFIAFSSDEDARQAMMLTNKVLQGSPVSLFLSSKTEMQGVIAKAKQGPSVGNSPQTNTPDQHSQLGHMSLGGLATGYGQQMGGSHQQHTTNVSLPTQLHHSNSMPSFQSQSQMGYSTPQGQLNQQQQQQGSMFSKKDPRSLGQEGGYMFGNTPDYQQSPIPGLGMSLETAIPASGEPVSNSPASKASSVKDVRERSRSREVDKRSDDRRSERSSSRRSERSDRDRERDRRDRDRDRNRDRERRERDSDKHGRERDSDRDRHGRDKDSKDKYGRDRDGEKDRYGRDRDRSRRDRDRDLKSTQEETKSENQNQNNPVPLSQPMSTSATSSISLPIASMSVSSTTTSLSVPPIPADIPKLISGLSDFLKLPPHLALNVSKDKMKDSTDVGHGQGILDTGLSRFQSSFPDMNSLQPGSTNIPDLRHDASGLNKSIPPTGQPGLQRDFQHGSVYGAKSGAELQGGSRDSNQVSRPPGRDGRFDGPPGRECRFDGPPGRDGRYDGPPGRDGRFDGPPLREGSRFDGPPLREGSRFDGPPGREGSRFDGPPGREDRFDGPPGRESRFEGPPGRESRFEGPPGREGRFDGPPGREGRSDGPPGREGSKFEGSLSREGRFQEPPVRESRFEGTPGREGRFEGPPDRFDGPPGREGRFDGPPGREGRFDGPLSREGRFDGPPGRDGRYDGPPGRDGRYDGPPGRDGRFDGPPGREGRFDGPPLREGSRFDGPPGREGRFEGPPGREGRFGRPPAWEGPPGMEKDQDRSRGAGARDRFEGTSQRDEQVREGRHQREGYPEGHGRDRHDRNFPRGRPPHGEFDGHNENKEKLEGASRERFEKNARDHLDRPPRDGPPRERPPNRFDGPPVRDRYAGARRDREAGEGLRGPPPPGPPFRGTSKPNAEMEPVDDDLRRPPERNPKSIPGLMDNAFPPVEAQNRPRGPPGDFTPGIRPLLPRREQFPAGAPGPETAPPRPGLLPLPELDPRRNREGPGHFMEDQHGGRPMPPIGELPFPPDMGPLPQDVDSRSGFGPMDGDLRGPPHLYGGEGNRPPRGFPPGDFHPNEENFDQELPFSGQPGILGAPPPFRPMHPRDRPFPGPRENERGHKRHHGDMRCYALRMKNLPTSIAYKDLRRFFSGIDVPWDGLKVLNDKDGERTGEALVRFDGLDSFRKAMTRNGQMIGDAVVEINECSMQEFDAAVDSYRPPRDPNKRFKPSEENSDGKSFSHLFVVQLRNLNLNVIKEDIKKHFQDIKLDDKDIHIEYDVKGRATGIGFIILRSKNCEEKALAMDGSTLGSRTLRVSPSKMTELQDMEKRRDEMLAKSAELGLSDKSENQFVKSKESTEKHSKSSSLDPTANKVSTNGGQVDDSNNDSGPGFTCVKVQGIPPHASVPHMEKFFSGLEIAPKGIHFVKDSFGNNLGEVFIEFVRKSDCSKAIQMNGRLMEDSPISVEGIGKGEMQNIVSLIKTPIVRRPIGGNRHLPPLFPIRLSNLPYETTPRDLAQFCANYRPVLESIRVLPPDPNGGVGIVGFRTKEEAELALTSLNQRVVLGKPVFICPAPIMEARPK